MKDRKGQGYYRIDDVITQLGRTNMASFNLEMLCGEGSKKNGDGNSSVGYIDILALKIGSAWYKNQAEF